MTKPTMIVSVECPACLQDFKQDRQQGPRLMMKLIGKQHDCGAVLKIDWTTDPHTVEIMSVKPKNDLMSRVNAMEEEDG